MAAPTIVQNKTGTAQGTQVQLTFDSNVTSGNLIVVICSYSYPGYSGTFLTAATVSDGQSNTYVDLVQAGGGSEGCQIAAWYAYAGSTGALTVTINGDQADSESYVAQVFELSGAAASNPVDDSDGNVTGFITANDPITSPQMTTTGAALIFGACNAAGYTPAYTITPNVAWTSGFQSTTYIGISVEYRSESASGNFTPTWTAGTTYYYDAIGFAIKGGDTALTPNVTPTDGPTISETGTTAAMGLNAVPTADTLTWGETGTNASRSEAGQYAYPISDVALGNWTDQADGTTNIYTAIDEATTPVDTDYIRSGTSPSNDTYVAGLTALATPDAGTVTLRVRARWAS